MAAILNDLLKDLDATLNEFADVDDDDAYDLLDSYGNDESATPVIKGLQNDLPVVSSIIKVATASEPATTITRPPTAMLADNRRLSEITNATNASNDLQDEVRRLLEQLERAKLELVDQMQMNKLLIGQQPPAHHNHSSEKLVAEEFAGIDKEMKRSSTKTADSISLTSKASAKSLKSAGSGWNLFRSKSQTLSDQRPPQPDNKKLPEAAKMDESGKPATMKKKKKERDDRPLMVMIDF
ncbi:hypothetical protein HK100_009529 [Physocladia obscura]|uniref:Uncharacterized protein n=1 Tax=Physocladia obscura TaxID=109957 RepID=A0AAD5T5V6_9FUNG|nr:hypothetical protein HK100_009529 [Physocladia obscura]